MARNTGRSTHAGPTSGVFVEQKRHGGEFRSCRPRRRFALVPPDLTRQDWQAIYAGVIFSAVALVIVAVVVAVR